MREWSKPASTLFLGSSLRVLCLFVYLSKIPLNYTYDGMVFASRVENDHVRLWDLFHPHHLLYTFLGRMVFRLGKGPRRYLGWSSDPPVYGYSHRADRRIDRLPSVGPGNRKPACGRLDGIGIGLLLSVTGIFQLRLECGYSLPLLRFSPGMC